MDTENSRWPRRGHSRALKVMREIAWLRLRNRPKSVRRCNSRGAHLESKPATMLERVWSRNQNSRGLPGAMEICRAYGAGSPGGRRLSLFFIPKCFLHTAVTDSE